MTRTQGAVNKDLAAKIVEAQTEDVRANGAVARARAKVTVARSELVGKTGAALTTAKRKLSNCNSTVKRAEKRLADSTLNLKRLHALAAKAAANAKKKKKNASSASDASGSTSDSASDDCSTTESTTKSDSSVSVTKTKTAKQTPKKKTTVSDSDSESTTNSDSSVSLTKTKKQMKKADAKEPKQSSSPDVGRKRYRKSTEGSENRRSRVHKAFTVSQDGSLESDEEDVSKARVLQLLQEFMLAEKKEKKEKKLKERREKASPSPRRQPTPPGSSDDDDDDTFLRLERNFTAGEDEPETSVARPDGKPVPQRTIKEPGDFWGRSSVGEIVEMTDYWFTHPKYPFEKPPSMVGTKDGQAEVCVIRLVPPSSLSDAGITKAENGKKWVPLTLWRMSAPKNRWPAREPGPTLGYKIKGVFKVSHFRGNWTLSPWEWNGVPDKMKPFFRPGSSS